MLTKTLNYTEQAVGAVEECGHGTLFLKQGIDTLVLYFYFLY